VKFGIGPYSMQVPPGDSATPHALHRHAWEQIQLAERLGFHSAWVAEHHFLQDDWCPSPLVALAAIAAKTERITLGTCCLLLPLYDPIHVAEDASVVDHLSNGRLVLGLAAAYRGEEFAGFAVSRDERGGRFEEGLTLVKQAWTEPEVSFQGRYYTRTKVSVTPKPVQKPHPPIWIGTSGHPGIRRAARLGYTLVASNRHHPREVAEQFAFYRKCLRDYTQSAPEAPLMRTLYVAPTQAEAEADARDPAAYVMGGYSKWAQWRAMRTDTGQDVQETAGATFEAFRERMIIGTPAHCAKEIERHIEELGINHLLCWMQMPGLPHAKAMRSIELFARDVLPSFAQA
jgi:luciferase family oxidoreductase group 1